jgi:hypothetical protein
MKFTKFMVLVGGVLALVAFFLPYGTMRAGGVYVHVSAFDVLKGIDSIAQISNVEGNAETDAAVASQTNNNETKGYTMLVFGPPLLLLAIGGVAVGRKKLGRLGGVGALLLGLWAAVMAAALMSVVQEAGTAGGADVGAGTYVFLLAGLLGALGGLLALIKPDRGPLAA